MCLCIDVNIILGSQMGVYTACACVIRAPAIVTNILPINSEGLINVMAENGDVIKSKLVSIETRIECLIILGCITKTLLDDSWQDHLTKS